VIPSPILFGLVIDKSCLIYRYTCGIQGACAIYDLDKLRFGIHGFSLGLKLMALVCYFSAWMLSKRPKYVKQWDDGMELGKTEDGSLVEMKDAQNNVKA